MRVLPAGTPPFWLAYVGVDDIKASTKRAKELGAKIMVDVTEVGDFGLLTHFWEPAT